MTDAEKLRRVREAIAALDGVPDADVAAAVAWLQTARARLEAPPREPGGEGNA